MKTKAEMNWGFLLNEIQERNGAMPMTTIGQPGICYWTGTAISIERGRWSKVGDKLRCDIVSLVSLGAEG
jgi:hypothetical protein